MKYTCITKYIHCSTINKYTKSFLITNFATEHWSKPYSNLDTSLGMYLFFDSEQHLGRSKEFNNQDTKVQVKRTFKGCSFFFIKKCRQALLETFLNHEY